MGARTTARAVVGHRADLSRRTPAETSLRGVEVETAVVSPRQRPLTLFADVSVVVALPDFQAHRRPGGQLVVDAFQEVVEEDALPFDVLRLVVVGPLLAPVHLEPLLARGDLLEPLEGASGVQALIGPTRDDVRRRLDRVELC